MEKNYHLTLADTKDQEFLKYLYNHVIAFLKRNYIFEKISSYNLLLGQ